MMLVRLVLIPGTQVDAKGLAKLDPLHVSAWAGIFQGGVITGNIYGGL